MNDTLIHGLIAAGLMAIIALILLIGRQLRQERARRRQQAAQEADWLAQFEAHQSYLRESIQLIAHALLHDRELPATEGCIRLKVLLENFRPGLLQEESLQVISEIYDKTCHIPIRDRWQALPKKLKREYRREMAQLEEQHRPAIERAARVLSSDQWLS